MTENGGSTTRVANRYRLERRIGRGGAGAVWRAHDENLDRKVAVKQIAIASDTEARSRGRALREARAAARLHVPNVVQVYDVIEEGGSVYLIMELVEAPNLSALVRRKGALSPRDAAALGLQMLDALEAAHRAGVVHRDVKPSNVLIHRDTARLTDFGIARLSDDPTLTATGVVMGTPAYIAPEYAQGSEIGPAVDLYGLGATLYYAVEGRSPYGAEGSLSTVLAVINSPPRPLTKAGPLTDLLSALLAKDPEARPSPDEIRRQLEEVAGQSGPQLTDLKKAPWVGGVPAVGSGAATGDAGADEDATPDDGTATDEDITPQTGIAAEEAAAGEAAGTGAAEGAGVAMDDGAAPDAGVDGARTADAAEAGADGTGTDVADAGGAVDSPSTEAAGAGVVSPDASGDVEVSEPADSVGEAGQGAAAPVSTTIDRARRSRTSTGAQPVTPAPRREPPRSNRRRMAILASVLGLLAVAALGLNSVLGDRQQSASDEASPPAAAAQPPAEAPTDADGENQAAGTAPTPSPSPSPEPSEPSGDDEADEGDEGNEGDGVLPATDAEVPEDWVEFAPDHAPYRLRHPPDWEIERVNETLTDIRDPQTGTYLRLDWVNERRDPVGAWEQLEPSFASRQSGYERIGITPTTFKGDRAALWEYRYQSGGAQLHAYNLGVNQDDHGFALNLQARQDDWEQAQDLWAQFLSSYEFTG